MKKLSRKKLVLTILLCGLLSVAFSVIGLHRLSQGRLVRPGERREGVLRQSDPIRSELPHGPENRWSFEGRAGQSVMIAAESYEFDVYLLLVDPQNHPIDSSDNNRGFFNAQIQATLQTTGRYTVAVCGANAEQFGTYWLSLDEGIHDVDWSQVAAESYYRRAIEWAEHSMSRRALSWINLGMAQYLRQRRQWGKAEKYYAESLARAEEDDFTYGQWAVALESGQLFARCRWYDKAVSEFQRALQLSKKLRGGEEAETLALIDMGDLYYASARADMANIYFDAAKRQAQLYALPSTLVKLYTSLNAFLPLKDKDSAIKYAEMSYELRNGLDPMLELKAINALAGTYLFLEPDKAQQGMALASEARSKAERLGCLDEAVSAITLMSMSEYAANNTEEMILLAGEALDLIDPADENPNARRVALQLQADGEMSRGNNRAALDHCLKALRIVESAWAGERIEELQRELLSQSRAICTQVIANLYALNIHRPNQEYARQAFDYAERSRSRSLLEYLPAASDHAEVNSDRQVLTRDREILDKLSAVRGQLALLRSSSYVSRDKLRALQQERANLIAERIRFQGDIRQSMEDNHHATGLLPMTAEQVQKKLAQSYPNSVILNYQPGMQESFLIILTRSEAHLFKLPGWKTISKAVADWRVQISSQLNSSRPSQEALHAYNLAAHRLYKILVEPAARYVRGHQLIVIPSDALSQVAFEALVVNEPGNPQTTSRPQYLMEQHAISYAPSASVLSEIESRWKLMTPTRQMLLLGDVSTAANGKASEGDGNSVGTALDRLPATREEVLQIARLARRHDIVPTTLLGSDASEDRFKSSNLSAYRFIHIATHGISDYQDGAASALMLAHDLKGGEDGFLTGDEIAKLSLKADLVVLSGCETSTGQKDGAEGIVGLNRAFLIAGSRSVCGSLWPVEDSWAQKLMNAFYKSLLADRHNKAQALRLAKLKMLKSGASTYQWAPFIIVGSPQ